MSAVLMVLFKEKYLSGFTLFKLIEVEIKPALSRKKLTNLWQIM